MRLLRVLQVIAGWDLFFEVVAIAAMFLLGLIVVSLRACNG